MKLFHIFFIDLYLPRGARFVAPQIEIERQSAGAQYASAAAQVADQVRQELRRERFVVGQDQKRVRSGGEPFQLLQRDRPDRLQGRRSS